MTKKYIIDKEDLPMLIKGEALALYNGNAFSVEVNGTLTNGDVIKAIFPSVEVKEKNNGYEVYFGVGTAIQYFNHQWWNSPYKEYQDVCKDCYYNDGEVHAECVICDKAESEEENEQMESEE